jgi:hypothetical protein
MSRRCAGLSGSSAAAGGARRQRFAAVEADYRFAVRTFALGAIDGVGVSVQLALAGRAVASTGSATEEASQLGSLTGQDPCGDR